ncbi:uncharacterized protein LOC132175376 [Corylus avellana]|uniref:uncharacterized protein LOC132175376 n=1 Tax=Corylus avellana TaxID=13451 RepID=UPI001E22C0EC|nr:uncharacterized protein LOC132175376 [Corylus avellana]
MGNCQAIDAATLELQHPNGKVDKFYWSVSASEIMKMNPGHYVALLISTALCPSNNGKEDCTAKNDIIINKNNNNNNNQVRVTRIKLLRPTDTLVLGQVYRLITAQEVMKGLWAKKQAKMKKNQSESGEKTERVKEKSETTARRSEQEKADNHVSKHERHRSSRTPTPTSSTNNSATARPRTWQPSLHSISEAAS